MDVSLGELITNVTAVNCRTQDEARLLLEQLISTYPEECKHWRMDALYWDLYKEHTCYAMYRDGDSGPKRLVYSPDHFFNDIGYKVISFGDLVTEMDLGEIDSDGVNLLTLFGAEVQDGD